MANYVYTHFVHRKYQNVFVCVANSNFSSGTKHNDVCLHTGMLLLNQKPSCSSTCRSIGKKRPPPLAFRGIIHANVHFVASASPMGTVHHGQHSRLAGLHHHDLQEEPVHLQSLHVLPVPELGRRHSGTFHRRPYDCRSGSFFFAVFFSTSRKAVP